MNYTPNHSQVDNRVINISGGHSQSPVLDTVERLSSLPPSWDSRLQSQQGSDLGTYGIPAMQGSHPTGYPPIGSPPIPPPLGRYPFPPNIHLGQRGMSWPPSGPVPYPYYQPFGAYHQGVFVPAPPHTAASASVPTSPIPPMTPGWPLSDYHQTPTVHPDHSTLSVPVATTNPSSSPGSVSTTTSMDLTVVTSLSGQHSESSNTSNGADSRKKKARIRWKWLIKLIQMLKPS